MRMKQKELYNVIENLPGELSNKFVDYIEYLKFSYRINIAPDDLFKDLLNKLKKGMEDIENGKVCTVEEAFEEVKGILEN